MFKHSAFTTFLPDIRKRLPIVSCYADTTEAVNHFKHVFIKLKKQLARRILASEEVSAPNNELKKPSIAYNFFNNLVTSNTFISCILK